MTQEEFKTFNALKGKLDKEVNNLWSYIEENYKDCLSFDKYSSFRNYDIYYKNICIEYYDHYNFCDCNIIVLPISDFINRPTEWADEWANNIRQKKKKKEEEEIKREKEELKRLKEKYESNLN